MVRFWLLVCCCGMIAGCSDGRPERVKISGKVTIDGKPLTKGTVKVFPQEGRPAYGHIQPDGRFTLGTFEKDDGCPTGEHTLVVVARETLNPVRIRWLAPKKYSQPSTSGLMINAENDREDEVIALTGEGGKPFTPYVEILPGDAGTE